MEELNKKITKKRNLTPIIVIGGVFVFLFLFLPAGAAQAATNIYYSVGQNTSDHKTGTPTITISDGVATFSEAQTALNMGVGDKISFGDANATTTVYISAKQSTTVWNIVTAKGLQPIATTTAAVLKISHAFSSLENAVTSASGADYLNTIDLVGGDYVLNIPCYFDSGPDQTAVTISGWTTGSGNYIKIYTPVSTSTETNSSQRHRGKWDDSKYSLVMPITETSENTILVADSYTRIEGLQLKTPIYLSTYNRGIYVYNSEQPVVDVRISGNLITEGSGNIDGGRGILFSSTGSQHGYIYNNIIYGFNGSGDTYAVYLNSQSGENSLVYNNTVTNSTVGIYIANSINLLKNNLCFDNGADYSGTADSSSTNNAYSNGADPGANGLDISSYAPTAIFAAPGDNDFLLTKNSPAIDQGADLSADPNLSFSLDVKNQTRLGAWDIGADEFSSSSVIVSPTKISLVASTVAGGEPGDGVTTAPINTVGATLLVVGLHVLETTSTLSITDNMNNNWHHLKAYGIAGASGFAQIWYAYDATTSAAQTFSVNGASNNWPTLTVSAWSGTATTSDVFDVENGNATTTSNTINSGSVKPAVNGELLISLLSNPYDDDANPQISDGFQIIKKLNNGDSMVGVMTSLVASSTDSINPNWTVAGSMVQNSVAIAAFKPATTEGAAPATTTPEQIYRSVGPGDTRALASSTQSAVNLLSVDSAGHATFASALPDKIGVGDVIIYDGNGDHLLNSSDVILFISGRNSATSYQVELENGTTSTATFSDNNTWSIYRAYTSLYNAVNASANVVNPSIPVTFDSFGGAKDLTAANQVWNIACYGDATDTARVYVYGWTTSPADYLRIYAPFLSSEVGASQRHSGTWDDTKYRLAVTAALDYVNAIGIYDKYVRVDGLQVSIANADYETTGAITLDSTAADGVIYISNNIIRGVYTTSGIDSMMGIFVYNPGTHYIFNNIVYGIKQGEYAGGAFVLDGGASYVYNNTIAGSELGILVDTGVVVAKNNIVQGADDGYIYEFDPTSDYNISNAADTTGGAHDQLSTSVAFANSVHDDYHLATNDTAAIGHGANLSADSDLSFSTDIDGQSRGAIWDIGADEYATTTPTQIYRSVGPGNTAVLADMDTTDSVLAINYYENSVATFSGGLPDNIGVGDAIVFDSDDNGSYDSLVFIYERLDATRFLVKTADGQTPSMTFSGAGLWKIYRAYTSLRDAANAASLVQNPSITIPFDNQPGIGNISNNATGTNEVWNIACYGDAVDTVGASVSGWTTGPDNYLRIYTPYLSSEVGISQRHSGKWDDAKYSLQPTAEGDGIYVTDGNDYTRIEGLQIQATTWAPTGDNAWEGSWRYGIEAGWSKGLIISHNIIRNGNQRSTGRIGIFVWPSPEEPTYIFDNLVYGFKSVNVIPGADVAGPNEGIFIESDGSLAYVFDNTVVDNSNGIGESYERAVLKNNLVFGSLHLDYEGTINSDSDYNAYASGTPYFESEGVNNEHGLNLSGYASTSIFVDPANQDYRLAENSPAINQGENLSADPNLSFADDIASVSRPQGEAWDIGANEYSGESFDITPPVITSFVLPATSSGLTVSGISVSATDNIGVTAYKFTESSTTPSFGSPDWQSASGTLSYSFATAGEKKLYAWAKDAAGNVSASASGTVDIVAAQIYYSVGQNTNDHKTGSPTITISGGVATFSQAQTATNLGVGDKISYGSADATTTIYISAKQSTTVWNVITAKGAQPAATTTAAVLKISHAFNSLANAMTGASGANYLNTSDLVAGDYILNIPCYYDSGPDTTSAVVNGYTTGVSNYIKIYTPNNTATEVNRSQRHSGKWDNSRYRLEYTGSNHAVIDDSVLYLKVEGLQIKTVTTGGGDWIAGIGSGQSLAQQLEDGILWTSNNIIQGIMNDDYWSGGISRWGDTDVSAFQLYAWNNIIYGYNSGADNSFKACIKFYGGSAYLYNNTVYGCNTGIAKYGGNYSIKNNISYDNNENYVVGGAGVDYGSLNNLSGSTQSDAPGSSPQNAKIVSFFATSTTNFHLLDSATNAIDHGANLSADPYLSFSTDIDGQTRSGTWDIGADEYVPPTANVYYSVGQNTDDHKTGAPTITIADGVAIFSEAQTALNMGVGDKISFGDSSATTTVYISAKQSNTVWNVVTRTGTQPTATTTATVLKISHAFNSLENAVTDAAGVNYLNTTDLVAGNYILNIPCYYDSGPDTAAVEITGWTTDLSHYLNIYTPDNKNTQANQSQRNNGKWDDDKFAVVVTDGTVIYDDDVDFLKIDGLQLKTIDSNAYEATGFTTGNVGGGAHIWLADNIIVGVVSGRSYGGSGISMNYYNNSSDPIRYFDIWNNIIYGFNNKDEGTGISGNSGDAIVVARIYNNTVSDCLIGILNGSEILDKNNISFGNVYDYYGNSTNASSTNNADGDGTALGSNVLNLSSYPATAIFADPINNDFRLAAGSPLIGQGVDLSGDQELSFADDITGAVRPAGDWDIGAVDYSFQVIRGKNSATINWSTAIATTSLLNYGTTESYNLSSSSAAVVTSHSITIKDLAPKTVYHFEMRGTAYGDQTFTSLDVNPPTITAFTLPSSTYLLTVPITSFSATDDTGVTGYFTSETSSTPLLNNKNWSASLPTSYTFSTFGAKKLYAWVRDADGNLSIMASSTVTITYVAPTPIYYSVGQNTDDHKTGAPNITINGGIATFDVAQTATNLGVGDAISYGNSSATTTIYISAKQSATVWSVITALGAQPAATTTAAVLKISHAFNSLENAVTNASDSSHLNTSDIVVGNYVLNLPCYYDSGPDTSAVTVEGWNTGASNYIKIYTPNNPETEVNVSQRHQGKWDDNKYNLVITGTDISAISIQTIAYAKIDGLQIKETFLGQYGTGLDRGSGPAGTAWFSNNIIWGVLNQDGYIGAIGAHDQEANGNIYAWNNIIYGFTQVPYNNEYEGGMYCDSGNCYAYNNTVYNSTGGFIANGGNFVLKNNISYNNINNYSGYASFAASSTNNLSGPTQSGAFGSDPQNEAAITFVNANNGDFHLVASDTAAIAQGANLSSDPNLAFSTDIDGQARGSSWDIGADEYQSVTANVYYSVGQNTFDHKTGSPTITISGGVATFSTAQTAANMGVGDIVTYGTGQKAFISGKISTSEWTLITALGATPADISGAAVDSITHAFGSLSDAVTYASDADFLNTTDLVAGNYVLNIPCYYDSGPDTTAVIISGWMTGVDNYIKIYTPNNINTEVNQRQRHSGRWDDNKYNLAPNSDYSINDLTANVKITGLQIHNFGTASDAAYAINLEDSSDGYVEISNNILRGARSAGAKWFEGIEVNSRSTAKVWNNIFYDFQYGIDEDSATTAYYYNNTFYGCWDAGIWAENATITAKNNLSYNVGSGGSDYLEPENFSVAENNLSSDNTSPNAALRNKTVSFADAAHQDFRLGIGDTDAIGAGENLSADANLSFTDDIKGVTRTGAWDVGADQFSFQIIRGTTTASILWLTEAATSSLVNYGTSISYGLASSSAATVTTHILNLKDLTPNTTYHFYLSDTLFGDQTFKTLDVAPPAITAFALKATSSSLIALINSFTATDDTAVTGYFTSESSSTPALDAYGWSGLVRTSHTFLSGGFKTLYAWVKDGDGNISAPASSSVMITLSPPTQIYRSVGPGSTGQLASGTLSFLLTISDGAATFSGGTLLDKDGVGDAIVYDSNDNGSLDSGDSVVFITHRYSNSSYLVQTVLGATSTVNISNTEHWAVYRAYTSLNDAVAWDIHQNISIPVVFDSSWSTDANHRDLIAPNLVWNIACYADAPDERAEVDGWTTGANNYVRVFTPYLAREVGVSQRHAGVWDNNKYQVRSTESTGGATLLIWRDFTRVEGLQIESPTDPARSWAEAVEFQTDYGGYVQGVYFNNNIIKEGSPTEATGRRGLILGLRSYADYYDYIFNNLIYNPYHTGVEGIDIYSAQNNSVGTKLAVYNNTIVNVQHGIDAYMPGAADFRLKLKNNLIFNSSVNDIDVDLAANGTSTNNAFSTWGNSDPTANMVDLTGVASTTIFADPAGGDYRLKASSSVIDRGSDLSTDPDLAFNYDFINTIRPQGIAWDIGADEYLATSSGASTTPIQIYRSVGPGNTSALASGSGSFMLTIDGGAATFSGGTLPDNAGVGDAIVYDSNNNGSLDSGDSIIFIMRRNSDSSYEVQTEAGATSTTINISATAHWAVYRAYTSLPDAIAGSKNSALSAIGINYDSWAGSTNDLVANDQDWNIACYDDAVDTSDHAVITGWNTGSSTYLRIYTPYLPSEVGVTQRHNGTWGNGYRRTHGIDISENYVRLDGLSIRENSLDWDDDAYNIYNSSGAGEVQISNCYGESNSGGSAFNAPYFVYGVGPMTVKIWNSIGISDSSYNALFGVFAVNADEPTVYLYNDTAIEKADSGTLSAFSPHQAIVKNCLGYVTAAGASAFYDAWGSVNYSASNDGTANLIGGTGNRINQAFSFANSGAENFHLADNDTSAKGYGTNLSVNPNLSFSTDIDGQTRGSIWDIGADQYFASSTDITPPVISNIATSTTAGTATITWTTDENATSTVRYGLSSAYGSVSSSNFFASSSHLITLRGLTSGMTYHYQVGSTDASGNRATTSDHIFTTISAANVYYSVGENTADHKTGSPTITISGGVATFSEAQTATNLGVGDKISYGNADATTTVYISAKQSTTVWNVVTRTGAQPTATTTATVLKISHAFNSLSAALPSGAGGAKGANYLNTADLVAGNYVLNIPCYYDSGPDTAPVMISNWTTSADDYLRVYTPTSTATEVNLSQRAAGVWNENKYRLEISNAESSIITSYVNNVWIDGLQLRFISSQSGDNFGIWNHSSGDNADLKVSHSIIRGVSDNNGYLIGIVPAYEAGSGTAEIWNNIIYGFSGEDGEGLELQNTGYTAYVYNNTVYDNHSVGIFRDTDGTIVAKNNLVFDNGSDYSIPRVASSTNNAYSNGSDPGTGGLNLSAVPANEIFADPAAGDLLLAYGSPAIGSGADLSADSRLAFADDIQGQSRTGAWDIGADQYVQTVKNIYYSVGQNTDDHKTGSPTLTIANGVGTFSEAQTATNMGVGDEVTYDTDHVAFISGKISTSIWTLVTASGGMPANVAGATVKSIAHAFDSLENAVTGASDPNHLDDNNLVTGDYVLNIPCYFDSGPDMTIVIVGGWITGSNNYIKIYTPNDTASEVNQSQRHAGKWDDDRYRLEVAPIDVGGTALESETAFLKIDGLQIKVTSDSDNSVSGIGGEHHESSDTGALWVSNNIIRGVLNHNGWSDGIFQEQWTGNGAGYDLYAWNNIIYGFSYGDGYINEGGIYCDVGDCYAYNNTIYGSNIGIMDYGNDYGFTAKNNLLYDNSTNYSPDIYSASSTNNLSGPDQSDAPGSNPQNAKTISFVNAAGSDFHLTASDSNAIGHGIDLSSDPNFAFNTDIDGQARGTSWDIGADQFVAPIISAIGTSTAGTTATITWTTDKAATSTVEYGLTDVYGNASSSNAFVTAHSITLRGLDVPATYHYRIKTTTADGSETVSADHTFTTFVSGIRLLASTGVIDSGDEAEGVTTPAINTTGASLIVVGLHVYNSTSTISITDSMNNTWYHLRAYGVSGEAGYAQIWYAYHPTTSPTQTFSVNGAPANFPALTVTAWSGISTTSDPYDTGNGNTANDGNTISTGSVTPASAGELLLSVFSGGDSNATDFSINSGFNVSDSEHNWSDMDGAMAYYIAPDTNSYDPTWTVTGDVNNSAAIAAFRPANTEGSLVTSTPAQIYRSVGPGNISALASGSGSFALTISNGAATFSGGTLPDNAGVGDAIVYDTNDNGSLDSGDSIVFIMRRNSDSSYEVQTETGATSTTVNISATTHWAVYRAYTSLQNAIALTVNSAIPVAFDNQFNTKNISNTATGTNEIWNIACYGDAADAKASVEGWTTGHNNYLRIYTPYLSSEVGVSQRHGGVWDDSKYHLVVESDIGVYVHISHVRVEGLQMKVGYYGITNTYDPAGLNDFYVSDNIVTVTSDWQTEYSTGIIVFGDSTAEPDYVYNNIVYGFTNTYSSAYYGAADGTIYLYNNTFFGNNIGIETWGNTEAWNNLTFGNQSDYNNNTGLNNDSDYNTYSGTAPTFSGGGNDNAHGLDLSGYASTTIFVDPANNNFLLKSGSPVIDAGANLSVDPSVALNYDISGSARPFGSAWDVGANEYYDVTPPIILNIATSTSASTATITWSTDEPATSTIKYGLDSGYGLASSSNSLETERSITLRGLNSATIYHFQIGSTDAYGNRATSSDLTFSTNEGASATRIYRSVGPGNTNKLASGTADNLLNISAGIATFGSSLPDRIGVGDALEYDANDNGVIDAGDGIAFIEARISATEYSVRDHLGQIPADASGKSKWEIYRAYTSLNAAVNGNLNPSLLVPSDDFSGSGRDLVANNEYWNIACYGDATDTIAAVLANGWVTGPQNYLRIYAPYLSTEVGISQRHYGIWDTQKYHISPTTNDSTIGSWHAVDYLIIDGLQIEETSYPDSPSNWDYGIAISGAGDHYFLNNIFQGNGAQNSRAIDDTASASGHKTYIANNLIYNFYSGLVLEEADGAFASDGYIYNNTLVNNNNLFSIWADADLGYQINVTDKNNLFFNNPNYYNTGILTASTTNNASDRRQGSDFDQNYVDLNTACGGSACTINDIFADPSRENFRLRQGAPVIDQGADLSVDSAFAFDYDLAETARPQGAAWDIGADEYVSSTPSDNIPPVITLTGTSTTATSATITWTTDEPATSSIRYGLDSGYGFASSSNSLDTEHSITLRDLDSSTIYHFQISSTDAAGNPATTSDHTFTTAESGGGSPSDNTPPTIDSFEVSSTSASLSVPIVLAASDDTGVTGYLVNEFSAIPSADDPEWRSTATTTYTFADAGSKTLYAWARDAAGNISSSASAPVTVTLPTYAVGGSVSGLSGTVTLQNNGSDDLDVSANGPFVFATALNDGATYDVTVLNQPSGQLCSVDNYYGTIAGVAVSDIDISCADISAPLVIYQISSSTTADTATIAWLTNVAADSAVYYGSDANYGSVSSSTPSSTSNSVTLNGLTPNNIYHFQIIADDSSGDSATTTDFTFQTALSPYTLAYSAGANGSILGNSNQSVAPGADGTAVTAEPETGYHFTLWSDSAMANPRKDINVAGNISVSAGFAINTYTITASSSSYGTIAPVGITTKNYGDSQSYTVTATTGYHVTGILVDSVLVSTSSTYIFNNIQANHVVSAAYASDSGADTYAIAGRVSGLSGTVVLQNNGGDNLSLSANGVFNFATKLDDAAGYNVTVLINPSSQTCTISSGNGIISGADVNNVSVSCATAHSGGSGSGGGGGGASAPVKPVLPLPDTTPPGLATNFWASSSANYITLIWVNPNDSDFAGVKIYHKLGSPLSSHSDPDAAVIYQGNAQRFVDPSLLTATDYYYSLYTYDSSLNYSTAVVVHAKTGSNVAPPVDIVTSPVINPASGGSTGGAVTSLIGASSAVVNQVTADEAGTLLANAQYVSLPAVELSIYQRVIALATAPLTEQEKIMIAYFIHVGTPTTHILGAGERGGSVSSFQSAYGYLPETLADWQDVLKIGNGRWPTKQSPGAIKTAQESFKTIYGRPANMNNTYDSNAITIMAYGLRPAQRNQTNEKIAIKAYYYFFKHNPVTARAWDAVRAIAYSGAKK